MSIAESFDGVLEINGTISVTGAGTSNEILYIPMRLRDIPQAISSGLQYTVNINSVWPKMPRISANSPDTYLTNYVLYNTFENTTALGRVGQIVENGTSKTIYIFVGIDQRPTPAWKDCGTWDCTTYYYNWSVTGRWYYQSNYSGNAAHLYANAPDWSEGGLAYWSSGYAINSGTSLYGVLQQDASSDPNHTVQLFWSFSSTDVASRKPFTYWLY